MDIIERKLYLITNGIILINDLLESSDKTDSEEDEVFIQLRENNRLPRQIYMSYKIQINDYSDKKFKKENIQLFIGDYWK